MKRRNEFIGRKRYLLAAAISLAVLAVLAWKADIRFDTIAAHLSKLDWRIFLVTLVGSALWHTLVGADKWWRVMRALGAQVGYGEVFRVRLGSDPIRFAAPMKVGELVNAAYFARLESLGFSRSAGSIVFDKSLNFFGTVFWLYIGAAAMLQLPTAGYVGLHTTLGVGVLALLAVRPVRQATVWGAARVHARLGRLAAGVLSAFEELSIGQKLFFLTYGVVFQLRPLVVCALMLVALQPETIPTWQEFLALGSVVVLMSNIPSLAGIGPREATLMTVFAGFADPATLLSAGLLMSFAVQVFPALLGIPLMFPLLRELASGLDRAKRPTAAEFKTPIDESTLPVSPMEQPIMDLKNKALLALSVLRYKLTGRRTPVAVAWLITGRCNLNCLYCKWKDERVSAELDTATVMGLIDQMRDAGVRLISFTGGEPLVRHDMGEIIRYVKRHGLVCKLNSNGMLVESRLDDLRPLDLLQISVDGPPDIQDRLRGIGTAEKASRAIRLARDAGIRVQLIACLTRDNVARLDDVLDYGRQLDVGFCFQLLTAKELDEPSAEESMPDRAELLQALRKLRELQARRDPRAASIASKPSELNYYIDLLENGSPGCECTLVTATMMPDGRLIFCGNAREYDSFNAVELGFQEAFQRLVIPQCDGCVCVGKLRLSKVYQLDSSLIKEMLGM